MKRAAIIMAGFAAALAVTPALACSPAEMKPGKPVKGDLCAVSQVFSAYEFAAIDQAKAIAPGVVMQMTSEGNICAGMTSAVVQDCASGQVLILGEKSYSMMEPDFATWPDRLDTALGKAVAKGFDAAALSKAAAGLGLTKAVRATTADTIRMSKLKVKLDCGCKTLFPALKPGRG